MTRRSTAPTPATSASRLPMPTRWPHGAPRSTPVSADTRRPAICRLPIRPTITERASTVPADEVEHRRVEQVRPLPINGVAGFAHDNQFAGLDDAIEGPRNRRRREQIGL